MFALYVIFGIVVAAVLLRVFFVKTGLRDQFRANLAKVEAEYAAKTKAQGPDA
ncbi:hypothetical protein OVY01_11750 [Robbsia sp. Bb-Pol-6]|uniref:Uncharacterized protein n=1 Tax=Robbsia betulipollinis TaxID=2981849 RepID=A0ABT3ZMY0_9BURK|nr:hypothetical protein [Robbsia betulipollinis]MCY0387898.1 hypothetical protein [Robbsia betulipollinis]